MALEFGRRRQLSPRRPHQERGSSTAESAEPRLVPRRFEALVDALLLRADVASVCAEIGYALAQDGAALQEALDGLCLTYELMTGQEPPYQATRGLAVSWSEASLQYLHALSCEDPLTGLASLAHVRARLAELYREAERRGDSVTTTYALAVVELVDHRLDDLAAQRFDGDLQFAAVAECLRRVYSGGETLGRLGPHRAVAVVARTASVGQGVAVLRTLLADWGQQTNSTLRSRIWIEPLPGDNNAAGRLLDELTR